MPPMPEIGRPRVSASRAISATMLQRDRLDRRAAVAAVRAHAVGRRARSTSVSRSTPMIELMRVDQRHRVGAAVLRGARRRQDVGDVGRELHDHRQLRVLLAPARDHLDVLGHLAHRRAHAALAHAVRAAEVELDAVAAGVLDLRQDRLPGLLVARHHQRDDERAVGPVALDLADLVEVDLERPVGDQLDVVEADHAPVVRMRARRSAGR